MKSDIQIAQEAEMLPIKEVAEKLGIGEDDLELYGKYKAKLSDELIERVKKSAGWKADSCDSNQSNSGWRGKNNDKCRTWTGIWPFGEKGSDRIA